MRWNQYSGMIAGSSEAGRVGLFLDYNLLNWTFGFALELDDCWTSVHVQLGPVGFELIYWRT